MLGGNALFPASNVYHAFTAVASRLRIDLCVNTAKSVQFARETVGNHPRLLIGVGKESDMVTTAAPSESVVADVAATLLVRNDGTKSEMETWTACIRTLSGQLLGGGIIYKGVKGELFGRLLCILARDQLPVGLSAEENFRYSHPFKVEMFLNELLGDGTVNGLLNGEIQRRPHVGAMKGTLPVWDEKFDFRQGCGVISIISHTQPKNYLGTWTAFSMSSATCSGEMRCCSWLLAKAIGIYFCLFIPETSTNPLREIIFPRFSFRSRIDRSPQS